MVRGGTNRRRSTGTTDPKIAEKKKVLLAQEIYQEFDLKQADAEQKEANAYDAFAHKAITDLAIALKYNRGVIPALNKGTSYSDLEEMKRRLDEAVKVNDDDSPELTERMQAEFGVMQDARQAGVKFEAPPSIEFQLPSHVSALSNITDDAVTRQKMVSARSAHEDASNVKKTILLEAYSSTIVESFWQDLLTSAAREQQIPEPIFDDVGGIEFVHINGRYHPKSKMQAAAKMLTGRSVTFPDAQRERQVQSSKRFSVIDVREEYADYVKRRYAKANTQGKWLRAVDRFVEMLGDLSLSDIKPLQAYRGESGHY